MMLTFHHFLDGFEIFFILNGGHNDRETEHTQLFLGLGHSGSKHLDDGRVFLGRHIESKQHLLDRVAVERFWHFRKHLVAVGLELQRELVFLFFFELCENTRRTERERLERPFAVKRFVRRCTNCTYIKIRKDER